MMELVHDDRRDEMMGSLSARVAGSEGMMIKMLGQRDDG